MRLHTSIVPFQNISINSKEIIDVDAVFVLLSPNIQHAQRDDRESAFKGLVVVEDWEGRVVNSVAESLHYCRFLHVCVDFDVGFAG